MQVSSQGSTYLLRFTTSLQHGCQKKSSPNAKSKWPYCLNQTKTRFGKSEWIIPAASRQFYDFFAFFRIRIKVFVQWFHILSVFSVKIKIKWNQKKIFHQILCKMLTVINCTLTIFSLNLKIDINNKIWPTKASKIKVQR